MQRSLVAVLGLMVVLTCPVAVAREHWPVKSTIALANGERPIESFPRHLALQNMWLTRSTAEDQFETIRLRDPDSDYFRRSLTARFWYRLKNGKQYWQVENKTIPAKFLREYKARYLQTGPR